MQYRCGYVHAIEEAVNAAMLQIAAHKAADMQVLGLAGHAGAHAADAAHDHINAHTGTAGFLQLEDDIPVADGVVFQDHGCRTAHAGGGDDTVHLFQQYALEAQRCHQHSRSLSSVSFCTARFWNTLEASSPMPMVCRDEGIVGVKLAGLFVVVAGADLGDVGVALLCPFW